MSKARHILLFFISAVATIAALSVVVSPPQPSIIVFAGLEATRADHIGPCYGYERNTAPNLCRLANDSVLFEQAYAQGTWTPVSVPTLFTARTPREVGIRWLSNQSFSSNMTTFPDVLRNHGYQLWIGADYPAAFREAGLLNGFNEDRSHQPLPIDLMTGSKQFLFTYFLDTKGPTMPAERFRKWDNAPVESGHIWRAENFSTETVLNIYDASISSADETGVGVLINRLKEEGLYERALIIIWSDHGQVFGEHGINWSHGGAPYREMIHVPLIIKFPENRFGGVRVSEPVRLVDIPHTIFDYVGINQDLGTVGASLLPVIGRAADGFNRFQFSKDEREHPVFAARDQTYAWMVRRGNYTYLLADAFDVCVVGQPPDAGRGGNIPWDPWPEELYNLSTDPQQQHDISENNPGLIKELREDLCRIYNLEQRNPEFFVGDPLSDDLRTYYESLGAPYAP